MKLVAVDEELQLRGKGTKMFLVVQKGTWDFPRHFMEKHVYGC